MAETAKSAGVVENHLGDPAFPYLEEPAAICSAENSMSVGADEQRDRSATKDAVGCWRAGGGKDRTGEGLVRRRLALREDLTESQRTCAEWQWV